MNNTSPLIVACHWITRMAWLNIIWLALSLSGVGILGVIPASVVVNTLLRRYLNGANKVTFSEAWVEFKAVFLRSNQLLILLCLPLGSVAWYVNWIINKGSEFASVISLALIPLLLISLLWLLCCIVQMSIYQTPQVKDDMHNGLTLMFTEKKLVLICISTASFMLALAFVFPILFLIFGPTPVFTCAIAWLWHNKEELNTLSM